MQCENIPFFPKYPWTWTKTWRSWSMWHRIWYISSGTALLWTQPARTLLPFRKCKSHAGSNCQRRDSFPEDAKTPPPHKDCQRAKGWIEWIGTKHWCRCRFWLFNTRAVKSRIFLSPGTWLHRRFFPLRIFRESGRTPQRLEKALISSSFSLNASAFSVICESYRGRLTHAQATIPGNAVWATFSSWTFLH